MSFEAEVRTRLIGQGITVPVLMGSSAVDPDAGSFIKLRTTGGLSPWRIHNTGAQPAYQRPSMQIVAHAPTAAEAIDLAYQAYHAVTVRDTNFGTTRYLFIEPRQEPFDLGLDARQRAQRAFNVDTLKQAT